MFMSDDRILELQKVECDFSVCKIDNIDDIDFTREFVFLQKTPDEVSLVCESAYVPSSAIAVVTGWKALQVSGVLDFDLIGIIAKIANILAEVEISIFVVSTYDTDYFLLKAEDFDRGIQELLRNGYVIKGEL